MKNISEHPKPEHIADDMPDSFVIEHVSDQRPWLSDKFFKGSGNRKIDINIPHESFISNILWKTEIIDHTNELEQNKHNKIDSNKHYQCIILQVIGEFGGLIISFVNTHRANKLSIV